MSKRIAFTFDDVPLDPGVFFTADERTDRLVAELAGAGIEQAGFFVVVGHFGQPRGIGGEARTRAYTAAGHVLGSHSHTHPPLAETSAEDFLADLDRAAPWFRGREGVRPWFRFPFLDEGDHDPAKREAVRAGLARRGLANAYVTVLTLDWYLESLVASTVREGRAYDEDALRRFYVESLLEPAEFYDDLAVRSLGRSPAHVVLLHENDLNTLFLADAARAFRAAGWEIVTVDEAYQDPIAGQLPREWNGSGRVAGLALDSGRIPLGGLECTALKTETMRHAFETRVLTR